MISYTICCTTISCTILLVNIVYYMVYTIWCTISLCHIEYHIISDIVYNIITNTESACQ